MSKSCTFQTGELANLYAALAGRETVREAAAILGPAGIRVMPLKGALLHALGCSDARLRPMIDVDLLVRDQELDRAVALLAEAGWSPGIGGRAAIALHKRDRPLGIDLHRRLYAYHRFGPHVRDLFRRARVDRDAFGVEVLLPDPLDLYAHLVGHAAKGRLDERQRSRLSDLARVAARFELDPERTAAHLDAAGLGRAARYTLSIARDHTGDAFAPQVLAALCNDPLGDRLAAIARETVRARPQSSKTGALAVALLDRSLLAHVGPLTDKARDALARGMRRLARSRRFGSS